MICWTHFSLNYLKCPDNEHDIARGAEDDVAEDDQEEDVGAAVQLPAAPASQIRCRTITA